MADDFDPPITLRNNITVFTLDDAAAFVRAYRGSLFPSSQDTVLRRLQSAATPEDRKRAAAAFRLWAQAEELFRPPIV